MLYLLGVMKKSLDDYISQTSAKKPMRFHDFVKQQVGMLGAPRDSLRSAFGDMEI
jgi:hypothetical protein